MKSLIILLSLLSLPMTAQSRIGKYCLKAKKADYTYNHAGQVGDVLFVRGVALRKDSFKVFYDLVPLNEKSLKQLANLKNDEDFCVNGTATVRRSRLPIIHIINFISSDNDNNVEDHGSF